MLVELRGTIQSSDCLLTRLRIRVDRSLNFGRAVWFWDDQVLLHNVTVAVVEIHLIIVIRIPVYLVGIALIRYRTCLRQISLLVLEIRVLDYQIIGLG